MSLRAGVAAIPLDPPLGVAMMGYGARTGAAQSRHDPLSVRALYLECGGSVVLVECDLCLLSPAQAAHVRARVEERTGVARERVLVGCIHTHSGPDTGLGALLAGAPEPTHVPPILEAAAQAACRSVEAAVPARLGWGRAEASIGRNRRRADGPLDREVLVLRVDRAGGEPLAVLFVHGCHPTALGHDNLAYSADWPGVARAEVERALPGATAVFALGAHADVDPRTRGLLDLAVSGQSVGVSFDAMAALGLEIGAAVARAASGIETRPEAAVAAASRRLAIPVHAAEGDDASYEARLAALRLDALAALDLPADADVGTGDFFRLEHERTASYPSDARRERLARVRRYLRDRTAPRFAGARVPEVEAQLLRIGDGALLGLPLEPTVDVGLAWKRACGAPYAAVIGIANGWLRYLPHPRNFDEPQAHQKYEILMSTLVPDAATRLVDAGAALLAALAPRAVQRSEPN
jgi:hypothetical protein